MRTREQLLEDKVWSEDRGNWIEMDDENHLIPQSLILEVLLDIRDLLIERLPTPKTEK